MSNPRETDLIVWQCGMAGCCMRVHVPDPPTGIEVLGVRCGGCCNRIINTIKHNPALWTQGKE